MYLRVVSETRERESEGKVARRLDCLLKRPDGRQENALETFLVDRHEDGLQLVRKKAESAWEKRGAKKWADEVRKRALHAWRTGAGVVLVVLVHLLDGTEELKED